MGFLQPKTHNDAVTLLASAARTAATGDGSAVKLPALINAAAFTLDVTVDESTTADKLDVFVQTKLDGTNWTDVAHFTQHDGDAGAERYVTKITADGAEAEFLNSAALAEASIRDLFGDEWRVRWAITDDSGSASYTFSVSACPM